MGTQQQPLGFAVRHGLVSARLGREKRLAFERLVEREGTVLNAAIRRLVDQALREDALPPVDGAGQSEA